MAPACVYVRYGYDLLVPDMRRSFGLDAAAVGLLGSGAYVTYLAATVASMPVVSRYGPRRVAFFAGLLATAGMAIIGRAPGVSVLVLAVIVAGASSGFAFPPFADLAAEHVDPGRRGDVLAAISSGTGWGVALAAPVPIALGPDWRTAWLILAAAALAVSATVRALLPAAKVAAHGSQAPQPKVSWFMCARSRPLLLSAFLAGRSIRQPDTPLAGGAVLRVAGGVFYGLGDPPGEDPEMAQEAAEETSETDEAKQRIPLTMVIPPAVLLAIGLGTGVLGVLGKLGPVVQAMAVRFQDQAAYNAAVLAGAHTARPVALYPPEPAGVTLMDLLTGLPIPGSRWRDRHQGSLDDDQGRAGQGPPESLNCVISAGRPSAPDLIDHYHYIPEVADSRHRWRAGQRGREGCQWFQTISSFTSPPPRRPPAR